MAKKENNKKQKRNAVQVKPWLLRFTGPKARGTHVFFAHVLRPGSHFSSRNGRRLWRRGARVISGVQAEALRGAKRPLLWLLP